ncbi:MAG: hypothetical protein Q4B28_03860 [bacterium]|nr:hypothetical protein [bacterium]
MQDRCSVFFILFEEVAFDFLIGDIDAGFGRDWEELLLWGFEGEVEFDDFVFIDFIVSIFVFDEEWEGIELIGNLFAFVALMIDFKDCRKDLGLIFGKNFFVWIRFFPDSKMYGSFAGAV